MFKIQTHIKMRATPISVDVGVGQRCRAPCKESPTSLPTMSKRNVPALRWNITCVWVRMAQQLEFCKYAFSPQCCHGYCSLQS